MHVYYICLVDKRFNAKKFTYVRAIDARSAAIKAIDEHGPDGYDFVKSITRTALKEFIARFIDPNGYECTEHIFGETKDDAWWKFIKNYPEICVLDVSEST